MADLSAIQSTEATRIVGSDSSGTETNMVGASSTGQLKTQDILENNYVSLKFTVGTSQVEAKVGGSRLTNRKQLIIYNVGNNTVYYGPTGVTSSGTTQGIPIEKTDFLVLPFGNVGVYLISIGSGSDVIVQEMA